MIERCYHKKSSKQYPAYYGICTVCDEWHNFQVFAEWYKKREYECKGRLHLDKDIKNPGNTVYSPENCLLVPQELNVLFVNKSNNRGVPNGIQKCAKGYSAKYDGKSLGVYKTIEDAYYAQTKKKKEEILRVVHDYKNIIPIEAYEAIIKYEFSIENDRNYKRVY